MEFTATDDLLHTPRFNDAQWTETNFFTFYMPEENMVGYIYFTTKANLGIATYYVIIYRGFPQTPDDFEHWDNQYWIPLPKRDLDDMYLDDRFRIRVIEPLHRYRVDYNGGTCELHLEFTGVTPAHAVTPLASVQNEGFSRTYDRRIGGGHMEQTTRITGDLILNGKTYKVDTIATRDHSWGTRNDKIGNPWQTTCWDYGLWDDGFGFRVMGRIAKGGKILNTFSGVICEDGNNIRIEKASGTCERDGVWAKNIVYEITDVRGNDYTFKGETVVRWPNPSPNPNTFAPIGYCRWTVNGRAPGDYGYGEFEHVWHVQNSPLK